MTRLLRRYCSVALVLLVGIGRAGAAGVPFALPPDEPGAAWTGAMALAGFVVGKPGAGPGAEVLRVGAAWELRVRDDRGSLHVVTVPRPETTAAREDLVWLAWSLLHPAAARTDPLAALLAAPRPVGPSPPSPTAPPPPAPPPPAPGTVPPGVAATRPLLPAPTVPRPPAVRVATPRVVAPTPDVPGSTTPPGPTAPAAAAPAVPAQALAAPASVAPGPVAPTVVAPTVAAPALATPAAAAPGPAARVPGSLPTGAPGTPTAGPSSTVAVLPGEPPAVAGPVAPPALVTPSLSPPVASPGAAAVNAPPPAAGAALHVEAGLSAGAGLRGGLPATPEAALRVNLVDGRGFHYLIAASGPGGASPMTMEEGRFWESAAGVGLGWDARQRWSPGIAVGVGAGFPYLSGPGGDGTVHVIPRAWTTPRVSWRLRRGWAITAEVPVGVDLVTVRFVDAGLDVGTLTAWWLRPGVGLVVGGP